MALGSIAEPPGWELPLGAASSTVGRTLELAEALHRSQCAELCTEASWPPIVGVVLGALAVSESREVQREREKVTDSVIPISSSHVCNYISIISMYLWSSIAICYLYIYLCISICLSK